MTQDEEFRLSFDVPAIHVNKMQFAATDGLVRVAFGEGLGAAVSPKYRVAVSMTIADAESMIVALREMITRAGMPAVRATQR